VRLDTDFQLQKLAVDWVDRQELRPTIGHMFIRVRWLPFLLICGGLIDAFHAAGLAYGAALAVAALPAWVLSRMLWALLGLISS
jgi:hypothetical protein